MSSIIRIPPTFVKVFLGFCERFFLVSWWKAPHPRFVISRRGAAGRRVEGRWAGPHAEGLPCRGPPGRREVRGPSGLEAPPGLGPLACVWHPDGHNSAFSRLAFDVDLSIHLVHEALRDGEAKPVSLMGSIETGRFLGKLLERLW